MADSAVAFSFDALMITSASFVAISWVFSTKTSISVWAFTVTADSYEESELEVPIFSEEDIQLVSQQAGVDEEKAKHALEEAKGDLARAILLLTSG